ncbi:MAG: GNAT family N-acetyltransferase [Pseudomonadota bacterium]
MAVVEVRKAEVGEVDAARQVIVETWLTTYVPIHGEEKVRDIIARWHTPEKIRAQIESSDTLFGVAEIDGDIVGHVLACPDAANVKISRLYVLPNAQRRGVGQKLLNFALAEYNKARVVSLEVDEQNGQAIRFYENNGFAVAGRIEQCGGDSDIPALLMRKTRVEGDVRSA